MEHLGSNTHPSDPKAASHGSAPPPQQAADYGAGAQSTMASTQVQAMDHQAATDYNASISDPTHYTCDPHRLTAYLVPFPKPDIKEGLFHAGDAKDIPQRFLIYTPPAPPLAEPAEGEKEGKAHKLQRKWQGEVREAKTNEAKVASWKGVKGRATKGIDWAMGQVTSSGLDFMNRIPGTSDKKEDKHADDGHSEGDTTKKTVGLQEMVMVYPDGMPGTQEQIREEFVNSMLRTKSKAQRDSIIATGLLPVGLGIDLLATVIWPFGGLAEIDAVWGASSIRGAKTARSVTKRLNSSGHDESSKLKLTFVPSSRTKVLEHYLIAECHDQNKKLFKEMSVKPTDSEVLEAIGWSPSQTGGETSNWEDEKWETQEVKEDFRNTMHKGAREWDKWCKNFEKDPEKALKKG